MGLDQYALHIDAKYVRKDCQTDFDGVNPDLFENFHQWRKHSNLQGWMEKLYQDKGGFKVPFNCAKVRITFADLEKLKEAVMADELPETQGFFFGASTPEDMLDDLEFIQKAKTLIKEGKVVVYDSWW